MPTAPAPASTETAPTLTARENLAGLRAIRRDQLGFLRRNLEAHGDVFRMRLGGFPMIMVNHPDYVHHILVENHANYDKDNFLYRVIRPILRDSLTGIAGGPTWRTHRRIMNPAFHRASVESLSGILTELTAAAITRWTAAGTASGDGVVDISSAASSLTLRAILRTLFGVEADADGLRFERAFLEVNMLVGAFLRMPFPPLGWPTPKRRRLRFLVGELDAFVRSIVTAREGGSPAADLFTMLARTTDEGALSADELAEEILGVIIAGYETSSHALAWVLYQLATHPDVQKSVHIEVDEVLDGRPPSAADLPRLPYTRMVIDETLRLCTPAWQTMRRAIGADTVGNYRIPAGSDVYLNLFTLHRHPAYWPDPDRFDPERFAPEATAGRVRHAYQPFGSGPRHCIGKHFALTQLHLTTAMVAQSLYLAPAPGAAAVGFRPHVTLHPDGGVHLRVTAR